MGSFFRTDNPSEHKLMTDLMKQIKKVKGSYAFHFFNHHI